MFKWLGPGRDQVQFPGPSSSLPCPSVFFCLHLKKKKRKKEVILKDCHRGDYNIYLLVLQYLSVAIENLPPRNNVLYFNSYVIGQQSHMAKPNFKEQEISNAATRKKNLHICSIDFKTTKATKHKITPTILNAKSPRIGGLLTWENPWSYQPENGGNNTQIRWTE